MTQDIDFLLNSVNMDEFRIRCTLCGIDVEDAVEDLKLAEDKGKCCLCLKRGKLTWCDYKGVEVKAPEEFNGNFDISGAPVTSLEGCPQVINGDFDCSATDITSLKGAPREVAGNFNFSCTHVKSLDGAPVTVAGYADGTATPVNPWYYDNYVEFIADPTGNIENDKHFDGTGHYKQ